MLELLCSPGKIRTMSAASTFALAQLNSGSSAEVVLSLKLSPDQTNLIASTSCGDLCQLDPHSLRIFKRIKAHSQSIGDFHFTTPSTPDRKPSNGGLSPSVLFSVENEGNVLFWDLRTTCIAPTIKIQTKMPLTSGHIEPFGSNIIVTGSERVHSQCPICFWDIRNSSSPLTTWNDTHSNDITTVRFYPERAGCLVSSSLDGLVCQSNFDALLAPSEDSTLQSVIQTDCPIDTFIFTPIAEARDLTAVISPMRTASLVQLNGDGVVGEMTSIRNLTREEDDIISIESNPCTDTPILFTTTPTGQVDAYLVSLDGRKWQLSHTASFGSGVHAEPVRSLLYLPEFGAVFTGGEDGRVVGWNIA